MEIKSGQQDVRSTFLRGSVGQTVAGIIWLLSTALGTWVSERSAILVLVLGGALIFPLTSTPGNDIWNLEGLIAILQVRYHSLESHLRYISKLLTQYA